MIITRTPFRVSFLGGGTDLPGIYRRIGGAVLSTTIDRYMYVIVNRRFEETIRVAYTKTEIVGSPDEVEHDLVREALKLVGICRQIEVVTVADVPAGTGLGSSSSLTVGLLNALHAHLGRLCSPEQLAREACEIEIGRLGRPIGKQDQYAVAYGGFNFIEFRPDEGVEVTPLPLPRGTRESLFSGLGLFYTGTRREAHRITRSQQKDLDEGKLRKYEKLKELAHEGREALIKGDLLEFGRLLHEGWLLKRSFSQSISNPRIDEYYEMGRSAGALGGKILGAGGGGFLLLFCPDPERMERVRETMASLGLRELRVGYEPLGSRIIFVG